MNHFHIPAKETAKMQLGSYQEATQFELISIRSNQIKTSLLPLPPHTPWPPFRMPSPTAIPWPKLRCIREQFFFLSDHYAVLSQYVFINNYNQFTHRRTPKISGWKDILFQVDFQWGLSKGNMYSFLRCTNPVWGRFPPPPKSVAHEL